MRKKIKYMKHKKRTIKTALAVIVGIILILGGLQFFSGSRTKPAITYDPQAQDRLLKTLKTRPSVSQSDLQAKIRILKNLPTNTTSGIVHQASTFRIEYVKPANAFLVEILTTDIEQAKQDTQAWLTSQGMSQQGICDAPVSFFLNVNVAETLRGNYSKFNPLPPGC